jgi:hypothetical protein
MTEVRRETDSLGGRRSHTKISNQPSCRKERTQLTEQHDPTVLMTPGYHEVNST